MSECLVVTYHYVRDTERTEFPALHALSVEAFERQIKWLMSRYLIIDYPTFEKALRGLVTMQEPTALLTFDDGLTDHYRVVFPFLRTMGLKGVFFIPTHCLIEPKMLNPNRTQFLLARLGAVRFRNEVTAYVDQIPSENKARLSCHDLYRWDLPPDAALKQLLNYEASYAEADSILHMLFEKHIGDEREFAAELYCGPEELCEMADAGMTLGGHSWHHRVLSRLSMEEQQSELSQAVDLIHKLAKQRSVPFCYPFGLPATFTDDTVSILKKEGYATAFTIVSELVHFERSRPFELPRIDARSL